MKSYTHTCVTENNSQPPEKTPRSGRKSKWRDAVFNSANTRVNIAPKNETLETEREKERERSVNLLYKGGVKNIMLI